jgi:hypothetical protein
MTSMLLKGELPRMEQTALSKPSSCNHMDSAMTPKRGAAASDNQFSKRAVLRAGGAVDTTSTEPAAELVMAEHL